MRLAIDQDDRWVVILEVESDQSRIRELLSGETRRVLSSTLSVVNDASLRDIGQVFSDPPQTTDSTLRTDRGWGLVLVVGAASPVGVRSLLGATNECESDLNGLLAELEAGGILERTQVTGERGYELSERGVRTVEALWSSATSDSLSRSR